MKKILLFLLFPVLSFSQAIQWQWAKNVTNTLTGQSINHLYAGEAGNFYLSTKGGGNSSVVKFNSGGQELWRATYPLNCSVYGITVSNGNLFVIGNFTGGFVFGTSTVQTQGNSDIFVSKFLSDGTHAWTKSYGGPNNDVGSDIVADHIGQLYFTGYYSMNATFSAVQLQDSCNYQMFCAISDSSGNVNTAFGGHCYASGSESQSVGQFIRVDSAGKIFIAGTHNYFFADTVLLYHNSEYERIFVAKYQPSGQIDFAKEILHSTMPHINDVVLNAEGDISFVGGSCWTNGCQGMVERYDYSGVFEWSNSGDVFAGCGYGASTRWNGLTTDGENSFLIGRGTPGGNNPNCLNKTKFCVRKLSSSGAFIFEDTARVESLFSLDIIRDSNGDYIICGRVGGILTLGTHTVANNIFIAKFKESELTIDLTELQQKIPLEIYPNPASGHFTVSCENMDECSVRDVLGRTIKTFLKPDSRLEINLAEYAKGIYFVEVRRGVKREIRKLSLE